MTSLPRRTPVRTFSTRAGRTWLVRVVPVGGRPAYPGAEVVDDHSGPMVEFYDTAFADDGDPADGGVGPLGAYVAVLSRAHLIGADLYGSGDGPLCLDLRKAKHTVDPPTMDAVRRWLRSALPTCGAAFIQPGDVVGGPTWVCTRDHLHPGKHAHHDETGRVVAIEDQPFHPGGGYDRSVLGPSPVCP